MDTSPPPRHGLPMSMEVSVIDIINVDNEITYCRCDSIVWVEESLDD